MKLTQFLLRTTGVTVLGALALVGCRGDAGDQGSTGGISGPPPVSSPPPEAPPPTPAALPPPVSGGTLAVLADGRTAVASDPDRDRVYLVDLVGRKLAATVTLRSGDEPGRHVADAAGRVHVALRGGGAVATIDPRTGQIVARRELCAAPRGLAYEAGKDLLHIACAGGELVSVAPAGDAPVRTLHLDKDLRDVVVGRDGLFVTTFRKAELLAVGETGATKRLSPARTQAVFQSFFAKGFPGPVPPGGDGSGLGTASPAVAWRMVSGPQGQPLVLHQRAVDSEVNTQPGGYTNGRACAGIVEGAVTEFRPSAAEASQQVRSGRALAGVVLGLDIAVSPDGRQAAVVSYGHAGTDRQLQFFSLEEGTTAPTPEAPCVPPAPTPLPPMGGTTPPDDGLEPPLEYRPPNGEVIAVAFDLKGNVIVQSREPATLQILTQRAAPITLSIERRADVGHQVFHSATAGLLACASCHPEGGEDSRTWKFVGLGGRRTQSLRGGIMQTAPFHWDGEFRSLSNLMTNVFQGRMGGHALDDQSVKALGAWIDQVPAVKVSPPRDSEAVTRGRALFASAEVGCATCHVGGSLTNNTSADVGTGGLFQVPQLKNLAFRAPYMHDGCATTLEARFTTCGGDDRHGVTSKLTKTQIADLVAYLETL